MFYNQFNINQNILTIRFPCWQDFILDVSFTVWEHTYGKIFQTLIIYAQFGWIYAATASTWAFSLGSCSNFLVAFLNYRANAAMFICSAVAIPCTGSPRHIGLSLYLAPESSRAPHYQKITWHPKSNFSASLSHQNDLPVRYPHTLPHSHLENQGPTMAVHSAANSTSLGCSHHHRTKNSFDGEVPWGTLSPAWFLSVSSRSFKSCYSERLCVHWRPSGLSNESSSR